MKSYIKIFLSFSCILFIAKQNLYAQDEPDTAPFWGKSNIGVSAGMINYTGNTNHMPFTFDNTKFAGELMYRYDVTDRFHIRGTLMMGALSTSKDSGSFKTNIAEIAILPEYDFINIHVGEWDYHKKWTPYMYAGPGFYRLFHYSAFPAALTVANAKATKAAFSLRWGIGVKYAVTPGIQLFFDGSRREFSKFMDFKYSENSDKSNDNYQSRYYTLMFGAIFSLRPRKHYSVTW